VAAQKGPSEAEAKPKDSASKPPNSRSFDRRLGREEPRKLLPGSEPRQETGVRPNRNRVGLDGAPSDVLAKFPQHGEKHLRMR
jgi:hypothetical protein